MFFEQSRIEAELAYARFLYLSGRHEQIPEVYANRGAWPQRAQALDHGLADGRDFVSGGDYSVADMACTRTCTAPPRRRRPRAARASQRGCERVEAQPGFVNDLEPVPAHASARPV